MSYLQLLLILNNQTFAITAFGILLQDLNAIFEQLIRVLFWIRSLIAIETQTYVPVPSFFSVPRLKKLEKKSSSYLAAYLRHDIEKKKYTWHRDEKNKYKPKTKSDSKGLLDWLFFYIF